MIRNWIRLIILMGSLLMTSCAPVVETPDPTPMPSTPLETQNAQEPTPGGTLVISYGGGTPRHFNPALISGSSTAIVGAQIFASPLRYDDDWNPQPYLAKSWEVAADGLSVTLHLVEGATFHDGEPVTSRDVAFSVMTVKAYHPFKPMFEPVERVDTPDDLTAIIRLSHPHPAILLAMSPALLPILPEHIYGDGQDIATHPANLAPIGSGPFRLVEYVPDESITLERFEAYFMPNRPYLDKLVIRLETNPDAQIVEMQRQTAHMVPLFVNPDNLTRFKQIAHVVLTPKGKEGLGPLVWLAFNMLREPVDDVSVRQAIAYTVDPAFITGYLHQGWSQIAPSPIAPGSPFYNPDIKKYDLDLDKANQLLDQAGYPRDSEGLRFEISLDYIPVLPSQFGDVALYLKTQLEKIGIQVQIHDSENFAEWAEKVGGWDFDMTLDSVYNWGDPVIGVHRTYMSDNIRQGVVWSNTQNYSNPKVDELLQAAAVEMDPAKRRELYFEFQQILAEDLPVIWINEMPYHTIYHTGLGSPPETIWGIHAPLDDVFWLQAPQIEYLAPPSLTAGSGYEIIVPTGIHAIQLLGETDFYTARDQLQDPAEGFLDIEGTGLHVIGFTQDGTIFLDNSGQLDAGIDISTLLDLEGNLVLPMLVDAAENPGTDYLLLEGVWPHPYTQELKTVSVWCSFLTVDDIVCALAWVPPLEGTE